MKIGTEEQATGLTAGEKGISACRAVLGIDIGTTNISAVIIDIERNTVLETYTVANASKLPTDSDLSEYDANWIKDEAKRIIDHLINAYPRIESIGVTGQMHGIVYVDEQGQAVSPLYNWQDRRASRKFRRDATYCDEIFSRTGYTVFPGYGFATLFYNKHNGIEPQGAKSFCTVMDYVAMALTDRPTPVVHPSNAAAFGLYDIHKDRFDSGAAEMLGLPQDMLPLIARDSETVGHYRGIPVSVAIGDNQASFYGSVRREDIGALVNFGTGSQISVVIDELQAVDESLEIRPYVFGKYLLCGSALCGGKAYSILERFFFKYAAAIIDEPCSQYEVMNAFAQKAYSEKRTLNVATQFCGTRKMPSLRGAITDIDDENFTPENLILGVLQGMVDELKTYFDRMRSDHITQIVAAGNAVQKNPVLQMLLEDTFRLPVALTDSNEEAAIGAALYAGVANGIIGPDQVGKVITYREEHKNELG